MHKIKIRLSRFLTLFYCLLYSLELWYNTILVLLTGNMENAEVQIDALAIWYITFALSYITLLEYER